MSLLRLRWLSDRSNGIYPSVSGPIAAKCEFSFEVSYFTSDYAVLVVRCSCNQKLFSTGVLKTFAPLTLRERFGQNPIVYVISYITVTSSCRKRFR